MVHGHVRTLDEKVMGMAKPGVEPRFRNHCTIPSKESILEVAEERFP